MSTVPNAGAARRRGSEGAQSDPRAGDPAARPPTRFDPEGKRALFEAPVSAPPEQLKPGRRRDGRDAMFSVGPPERGTVVVDCSSCHGRARVPLAEIGVRLLTGSFVIPLRTHGYWVRCPVCEHRTWCSVSWRD